MVLGAAHEVPAPGCEFFGGITWIAKNGMGDTEESVSTRYHACLGRAEAYERKLVSPKGERVLTGWSKYPADGVA